MMADRRVTAQALIGLLAIYLALRLQFLQDDAFISFRYAKNFADGLGLVWQPGQAVQGYTNFLWTLMLGIVHRAGVPMETAAIALGIAHFAGALALFAWIARRLFSDGWLASALLLLLATNYTYLAYATGGLATMQQSFWMLAATALALRLAGRIDRLALFGLSLCFAALMLTRFDSALFIVVLTLGLTWHLRPHGHAVAGMALMALPACAIFAAYSAWAISTYGGILPNTFHIKTSGAASDRLGSGALFAWTYYSRYLMHLPALVAVAVALIWRRHFLITPLAVYALVWTAYVVWTGGDFMEFRFFVSLTPLLLLVMGHAWQSLPLAQSLPAGLAALAVLISSSAYHGMTFPPHYRDIESIRRLDANLYQTSSNWVGIGQRFAEVFPQGWDGPVIGLAPAGAIPYYSGLPALDILGLNHDDVADDGLTHLGKAGHQVTASPATMERYGVNLLIAHPATHLSAIEEQPIICAVFHQTAFAETRPPEAYLEAPLLALEFGGGYKLAMLYLAPHPAVEAALASGQVEEISYTLRACEAFDR